MSRPPGFLDDPPPMVPAAPRPDAEADAPLPRVGPILMEPQADAPTGLRPAWAPKPLVTAAGGAGNGFWIAAGLLLALASWAGVSALSAVAALLSEPTALGLLGAAGIGAGLGLAGWGVLREGRDYRRLRAVDATRAALAEADPPVAAARRAGLDWLDRVGGATADRDATRQALHDAASVPEVVAILRNRVSLPLQAAVRRIGQDAAVEGAALIAISPHASWDGLIAAWKGLTVIRKVARLYGLRPGPLVTLALVRKVAWTAAGTAGIDLLSQTLADQALSSLPVARHIVSAVPGSGVAALRLYRLAWITASACDPVPG
jgi:putative membrane protein